MTRYTSKEFAAGTGLIFPMVFEHKIDLRLVNNNARKLIAWEKNQEVSVVFRHKNQDIYNKTHRGNHLLIQHPPEQVKKKR